MTGRWNTAVAVVVISAATGVGAAETSELKVSRVSLFSSGVGFFQCDSEVNEAELRRSIDEVAGRLARTEDADAVY